MERLESLLREACINLNKLTPPGTVHQERIGYIAEYLTSNGVVVQEQGEWIRQDETYTRFQCSRCLSENHHGYGNYCPNCGAEMKEVK